MKQTLQVVNVTSQVSLTSFSLYHVKLQVIQTMSSCWKSRRKKLNIRVIKLDTCCSAGFMTHTHHQQLFKISENKKKKNIMQASLHLCLTLTLTQIHWWLVDRVGDLSTLENTIWWLCHLTAFEMLYQTSQTNLLADSEFTKETFCWLVDSPTEIFTDGFHWSDDLLTGHFTNCTFCWLVNSLTIADYQCFLAVAQKKCQF